MTDEKRGREAADGEIEDLHAPEADTEHVTGGSKHLAGVKYENVTISCNTTPTPPQPP